MEELRVTLNGRSLVVGQAQSPFRVGRGESSDLVVDDPSVSSDHGAFTVTGGQWAYEDHSTYGSFVDGIRVTHVEISSEVEIVLAEPTTGPRLMAAAKPTPAVNRLPGSYVGTRPASTSTRIGRSTDNDFIIEDDRPSAPTAPWIERWLEEIADGVDDQGNQMAPCAEFPARILQFDEPDGTVYYVTYNICDCYSDLFDAGGTLIGHPDGGLTGKGDGSTTFEPVSQPVTIFPRVFPGSD